MPASGPSDAALRAAQISSYVAAFLSLTVRSTTDTSGVGTRKAMPVSLPLSSGMTLPTALAAPVEEGMMLSLAPRPPRQSLPEGPSTVFWVAVVACTVVMRPSSMPKFSWMTLARGARQLVVHEALETTFMLLSSLSWLTPMTNIGASAEGAEMTTRLAPPLRCSEAFSTVVKMPVDSTTKCACALPHGISSGFRHVNTLTTCPSMVIWPSPISTSASNMPCVLSCLKRYDM
mmetsp:Transcript_30147/g.64797  ORF Transcript_30147/g.64797 Transcript_30147/m.64797 type:complete len:232 (+) Transcript_30147:783-1478(+)